MKTSIIELAEKGDAKNLLRDLRVRALWSPYFLTKVVLGYKDLVDHLHLVETETFIERWLDGARKQWIEWPRGFFKSTTFTIGTSIWLVCPVTDEDSEYAIESLGFNEDEWFRRMGLHDQDATQLLAFETIDNAKKKITEIKWHFEENELFRSLFPEVAYTGEESPWNSECLKIRRAGYGKRSEEGTFEAIGAKGALQSRHYKIVWEDDLVGMKATQSESVMAETIRWHGLLSGAFENAAQQIRFGVSNRWGYHDLNSFIRQNEPDFVFHTRSAIEVDPESGEDVSIFPERYSIPSLLGIRDSGGMTLYDFSCQYLNSPVLPGETEVDASRVHRYSVTETGQIVCSCGYKVFPSQLLRYVHYDPYNAKGARSTSCPAIAAVGTAPDQKHLFLLEKWTARGNYKEVYEKLFSFNDKWRPYLFTYEDVGHQNMTEHHIRTLEKTVDHKEKHRAFPRIVPIPTHNKAKEIRVRENLLPYITRNCFAVQDREVEFTNQLGSFPNPALNHDYDLLDACAQGGAKDESGRVIWRFPYAEDREVEEKAKEDELLAHLGQPYSLVGG